jgi:hypothetical protein
MSSAIARVTSILAVPYGYTVALWSAGAMAVADHGLPKRLDVVLFAAGAVAAFLVLGLIGRAYLDREVPMHVSSHVVANMFPLLVAVAVAAVPLRAVAKPAAFAAASFITTTAYILSITVLAGAPVRPTPPKG